VNLPDDNKLKKEGTRHAFEKMKGRPNDTRMVGFLRRLWHVNRLVRFDETAKGRSRC
jgi:hypothetical protein